MTNLNFTPGSQSQEGDGSDMSIEGITQDLRKNSDSQGGSSMPSGLYGNSSSGSGGLGDPSSILGNNSNMFGGGGGITNPGGLDRHNSDTTNIYGGHATGNGGLNFGGSQNNYGDQLDPNKQQEDLFTEMGLSHAEREARIQAMKQIQEAQSAAPSDIARAQMDDSSAFDYGGDIARIATSGALYGANKKIQDVVGERSLNRILDDWEIHPEMKEKLFDPESPYSIRESGGWLSDSLHNADLAQAAFDSKFNNTKHLDAEGRPDLPGMFKDVPATDDAPGFTKEEAFDAFNKSSDELKNRDAAAEAAEREAKAAEEADAARTHSDTPDADGLRADADGARTPAGDHGDYNRLLEEPDTDTTRNFTVDNDGNFVETKPSADGARVNADAPDLEDFRAHADRYEGITHLDRIPPEKLEEIEKLAKINRNDPFALADTRFTPEEQAIRHVYPDWPDMGTVRHFSYDADGNLIDDYFTYGADSTSAHENTPDTDGARANADTPDAEGARADVDTPDDGAALANKENPDTEVARSNVDTPDADGTRADANSPDAEGTRVNADTPDADGSRANAETPDAEATRANADTPGAEGSHANAETPDAEGARSNTETPNVEGSRANAEDLEVTRTADTADSATDAARAADTADSATDVARAANTADAATDATRAANTADAATDATKVMNAVDTTTDAAKAAHAADTAASAASAAATGGMASRAWNATTGAAQGATDALKGSASRIAAREGKLAKTWQAGKDAVKGAQHVAGAGGHIAARGLERAAVRIGTRTAARATASSALKWGARLAIGAAFPVGTVITVASLLADPMIWAGMNKVIDSLSGTTTPELDTPPSPPEQFLALCNDGNRDPAIRDMDALMVQFNDQCFTIDPNRIWPPSKDVRPDTLETLDAFPKTFEKFNELLDASVKATDNFWKGVSRFDSSADTTISSFMEKIAPRIDALVTAPEDLLSPVASELNEPVAAIMNSYNVLREVNIGCREMIAGSDNITSYFKEPAWGLFEVANPLTAFTADKLNSENFQMYADKLTAASTNMDTANTALKEAGNKWNAPGAGPVFGSGLNGPMTPKGPGLNPPKKPSLPHDDKDKEGTFPSGPSNPSGPRWSMPGNPGFNPSGPSSPGFNPTTPKFGGPSSPKGPGDTDDIDSMIEDLTSPKDSKFDTDDLKVPGEDDLKVPGEDSTLPDADSDLPGDDSSLPEADSWTPPEVDDADFSPKEWDSEDMSTDTSDADTSKLPSSPGFTPPKINPSTTTTDSPSTFNPSSGPMTPGKPSGPPPPSGMPTPHTTAPSAPKNDAKIGTPPTTTTTSTPGKPGGLPTPGAPSDNKAFPDPAKLDDNTKAAELGNKDAKDTEVEDPAGPVDAPETDPGAGGERESTKITRDGVTYDLQNEKAAKLAELIDPQGEDAQPKDWRTAAKEAGFTIPPTGNPGTPISPMDLKPGDMVVGDKLQGIFLGDGQVLTSEGVKPLAEVGTFSGEGQGFFRLDGGEVDEAAGHTGQEAAAQEDFTADGGTEAEKEQTKAGGMGGNGGLAGLGNSRGMTGMGGLGGNTGNKAQVTPSGDPFDPGSSKGPSSDMGLPKLKVTGNQFSANVHSGD